VTRVAGSSSRGRSQSRTSSGTHTASSGGGGPALGVHLQIVDGTLPTLEGAFAAMDARGGRALLMFIHRSSHPHRGGSWSLWPTAPVAGHLRIQGYVEAGGLMSYNVAQCRFIAAAPRGLQR